MTTQKTPLYHEENNEFIGYLVRDISGWQAQTIFGYTIARTTNESDAEKVIREKGLTYLGGIWQYYDSDDYDWFPCVIKEASEHRVTVTRTNALGYQDPDDFKFFTIEDPTEEKLIKSA